MKATELMIGDWVSYDGDISIVTDLSNDDNGEFPPIQVYNEEYGVSGTYRVEPIPLTEEILKVNGFKCIDEDCCWYEVKGLVFYDHEHGSLNYLINDVGFPICNLSYVHDLQHALRLCGLDELADNFKVV